MTDSKDVPKETEDKVEPSPEQSNEDQPSEIKEEEEVSNPKTEKEVVPEESQEDPQETTQNLPVEEKVIAKDEKDTESKVESEDSTDTKNEPVVNEDDNNAEQTGKVSLDEEPTEDEDTQDINEEIFQEQDNAPESEPKEKLSDEPNNSQENLDEQPKTDLNEETKQESAIAHIENDQMQPEKEAAGFSLFYMFVMLVFAIGSVCVLLSCYYRFHLIKNKRAPFNAPRSLKPLFPTPVNYEFEISELCNKYMAQ